MPYYDVSLSEVTDDLLDKNKQLVLENIILTKALEKAKEEVQRLEITIGYMEESHRDAQEAEVPWEFPGDGPIDAGSVETVTIYNDEADTPADTSP